MLTMAPTEEMIAEWKRVFEMYHSSLMPNRKSGEEVDQYFREKYPSLKDMTFFSIECRENQELYARFASYMGNVVIVEPLHIKNKLQMYLGRALEKYNSLV